MIRRRIKESMAKDKSAAQSEQMERLIDQIAERVQARLIDIQEPTAAEASGQSDTRCVWELCGATESLQAALAGDAELNAACRLVSEASDASQGLVVAELPPTDMCRIVDGIGGSACQSGDRCAFGWQARHRIEGRGGLYDLPGQRAD